MVELTGRWKGLFTLGQEYGEAEGQATSFILFLEENEKGQFKGKSVDYDGYAENYNPASITGYMQGNTISFIKQYPFAYDVDEEGQTVYYQDKKHPEIHYEGRYDLKIGKFSGNWEMVTFIIPMGENDLEQLLRGKWEMRKDEDD